jgi:allantoinase
MSSAAEKVIFTGSNVLLADQHKPQPAAIVVDINTGKITEILPGHRSRQQFPGLSDDQWYDAGEKLILPGLVEYVD